MCTWSTGDGAEGFGVSAAIDGCRIIRAVTVGRIYSTRLLAVAAGEAA
jgi:hypothetical protein